MARPSAQLDIFLAPHPPGLGAGVGGLVWGRTADLELARSRPARSGERLSAVRNVSILAPPPGCYLPDQWDTFGVHPKVGLKKYCTCSDNVFEDDNS